MKKAETEKAETEGIETEKVEMKKVEIRRRRVKKFFATYVGKHGHISLSGIGRIFPGKPFEVTEQVANALRQSATYTIEEKTSYV